MPPSKITPEDLIRAARYMVETGCNIRDAAEYAGITHTAIRYQFHHKLINDDPALYAEVCRIMAENKIMGPKKSGGGKHNNAIRKYVPEEAKPKRENRTYDSNKNAPMEPLVIILEDLDFSWYKDEILRVVAMWQDEVPLDEIADTIKREPDEVVLLLMDLARKNKITQRNRGVFR